MDIRYGPKAMSGQKQINIGEKQYSLGLGGVHSTEQQESHASSDGIQIVEYDVSSFYPQLLVNMDLYPKHIGPEFLKVFKNYWSIA